MKTGTPWNNGLNTYTNRTDNVVMDGAGQLDLVARRETYTGADGVTRSYTSGGILSKDRYSFAYGHIEARIRVPTGRGFWSAFWDLCYPLGGEIDVLEHRGQNPQIVHTNLHGKTTSGGSYWSSADYKATTNLTTAFHVYGMTWEPGRISWQYDGQQIRTTVPGDLRSNWLWSFADPEWIILNLGVGGDWSLSPTSTTVFPSTMEVDWVRVYQ